MRSGDHRLPSRVQDAIDARVVRQRPRAIISAVLLLGGALVTFRLWRGFIRRSPGDRGTLVAAGIMTSLATLVLMAMAIRNTQGTVAPIEPIALLYG